MNAQARIETPLGAAESGRHAFAHDVLAGLSADPKRVPPKYFYDDRGSQLFKAITETPEYYLTRAEVAILEAHAPDIARHVPAGAAIVEFGSGSTAKVCILLRAAPAVSSYVALDIADGLVAREAAQLKRDFPNLRVFPVSADFTKPVKLPAAIKSQPRVGFFPGSTIGNFEAHEATAFLRSAGEMLGPGATLIVGVDLVKDPALLVRAYNDAAGVTAEFNLNLLRRINRELGANFNIEAFRHRALYNRERRRVEMHLVSLARQRVRIGGKTIDFRRGETIHTENSYKYTVELFRALARGGGWTPRATWLDRNHCFSVHLLVCSPAEPSEPELPPH